LNPTRALELPLDTDLSDFSALLRASGIAHHVFEERNVLVLEVVDSNYRDSVRQAWERYSSGEIRVDVKRSQSATSVVHGIRYYFAGNPVTLAGLLLSILGALIVQFDHRAVLVPWLTFTDFIIERGSLLVEPAALSWARGEYWRVLTPMFLHFGAMHIIFNSLWYLEFGHQIERRHGTSTMLALVVLIGAGSNIAQYITSPTALFGGMSGVIYGLLGYIWSWNKLASWKRLPLRQGIMVFMILWMVLCLSGFVEALGFGAVANAAHVGGFVMGLVLGAGAALLGVHRP